MGGGAGGGGGMVAVVGAWGFTDLVCELVMRGVSFWCLSACLPAGLLSIFLSFSLLTRRDAAYESTATLHGL